MAHESFEDEEVAKILNERFISIKVDREERPDIDAIYMSICQAMTGHGGWPLSVFLTPDQKAFYAGTYYPKEGRHGRLGFTDVLIQLSDQYKNDPEKITRMGAQIAEAILPNKTSDKKDLSPEVIHQCFKQLESSFDPMFGGFGEAPKFPTPHVLTFLLRYYRLEKNEKALQMVTKTLDAMASGGIYDHIGFGFSRYSVDAQWLVPHFEKMLYDNALLAIAYTEAFQITKDERFRKVADEIFTYILRDMQNSQGAFYSAEGADSEGVEGKFYVWTPSEVKEVLGDEQGELYCKAYDITEIGNFEGSSIPNHIHESIKLFCKRADMDEQKVRVQLEEARQKLFNHRQKRVHPHKDDKILTAWNGLMIAGLARASRAFSNQEYKNEAKRAVAFVEDQLIVDGRLMVRYRDGEAKNKGFIDDYANLLWAYIELYECSLDLHYLLKAKDLAVKMIDLFWDHDEGGFYFYGNDAEQLLIRPKELYDGAMPSGNSVAALQLLRLARLTGEKEFEEKVSKMFMTFSKEIKRQPTGYTYFLQSYLITQSEMKEVVVLTDARIGNHQKFIGMLQTDFYPEITYLVGEDNPTMVDVAPFTENYVKFDNNTTIYVCENFTCNSPTTNIETAINYLENE